MLHRNLKFLNLVVHICLCFTFNDILTRIKYQVKFGNHEYIRHVEVQKSLFHELAVEQNKICNVSTRLNCDSASHINVELPLSHVSLDIDVPKKNILLRNISKRLSLVALVLKRMNLFHKPLLQTTINSITNVSTNPQPQIQATVVRKPLASDPYIPKGILGVVKINMKRYVLNIWDNIFTPSSWKKINSNGENNYFTNSNSLSRDESSNDISWIVTQRDKQLKYEAMHIKKAAASIQTNHSLIKSKNVIDNENSRRNKIFKRVKSIVSKFKNLIPFASNKNPSLETDNIVYASGSENDPHYDHDNYYDYYEDEYHYNFGGSQNSETLDSNSISTISSSSSTSYISNVNSLRILRPEVSLSDYYGGYGSVIRTPLKSFLDLPNVELLYSNPTSLVELVNGPSIISDRNINKDQNHDDTSVRRNLSNILHGVWNIGKRVRNMLPFNRNNLPGYENSMNTIEIDKSTINSESQVTNEMSVMNNTMGAIVALPINPSETSASNTHSMYDAFIGGKIHRTEDSSEMNSETSITDDFFLQQSPWSVSLKSEVKTDAMITNATSTPLNLISFFSQGLGKTLHNRETLKKSKEFAIAMTASSTSNDTDESTIKNMNTANNDTDNNDFSSSSHNPSSMSNEEHLLSSHRRIFGIPFSDFDSNPDHDIESKVKVGPLDYKNDQNNDLFTNKNLWSKVTESVVGFTVRAVSHAFAGDTHPKHTTTTSSVTNMNPPTTTNSSNNKLSVPSIPQGALPWEVHYRAPIPFFENALKGPQGQTEKDYVNTHLGKDLTENLEAQVYASDAIDNKSPLNFDKHIVNHLGNGVQGFFIDQTDKLKSSWNGVMKKDQTQLEPEKEVKELLKDVFPLVTNTVKAIDSIRQQQNHITKSIPPAPSKPNALNMVTKASLALANANALATASMPEFKYRASDTHSVSGLSKGSAEPGEGVGLGLGLDPDYVDRLRLYEEMKRTVPSQPLQSSASSTETIKDVVNPSSSLKEYIANSYTGGVLVEESKTNVSSSTSISSQSISENQLSVISPAISMSETGIAVLDSREVNSKSVPVTKDWLIVRAARGLYKYTAQPVIQAPWILLRWTHSKITQSRARNQSIFVVAIPANSSAITSTMDTVLTTKIDSRTESDLVDIVAEEMDETESETFSRETNRMQSSVDFINNIATTDNPVLELANNNPSSSSNSSSETLLIAASDSTSQILKQTPKKIQNSIYGMSFLNLNFPFPLPRRKSIESNSVNNSIEVDNISNSDDVIDKNWNMALSSNNIKKPNMTTMASTNSNSADVNNINYIDKFNTASSLNTLPPNVLSLSEFGFNDNNSNNNMHVVNEKLSLDANTVSLSMTNNQDTSSSSFFSTSTFARNDIPLSSSLTSSSSETTIDSSSTNSLSSSLSTTSATGGITTIMETSNLKPVIEVIPTTARDFRVKPSFVVKERIPIPTKADFSYMESRRIARAVTAARNIINEADAKEFQRDIGIRVLMNALIVADQNHNNLLKAYNSATTAYNRNNQGKQSQISQDFNSMNTGSDIFVDERRAVVIAICRLCRVDKSVADNVASSSEIVNILVDMMEGSKKNETSNTDTVNPSNSNSNSNNPLRILPLHFSSSVTTVNKVNHERDREREYQEEQSRRQAVALMLRILRSSDKATNILKFNEKLRTVMQHIAEQSGDNQVSASYKSYVPSFSDKNNNTGLSPLSVVLNYMPFFSSQNTAPTARPEQSMVKGNITISDYPNLKTYQMARVASWALGGVPWKPRQHGQKGLRILTLDGGGTKGVLTVALLKELMQRIQVQYPHEVFDIICGTSTGAIIAALLGLQMRNVEETENLYDDLVDRIFAKKSQLKLMTEQASYDSTEWEKILYALTGEEMMLDSNRYNSSRVFMVSTKMNHDPPKEQIWRNYNYSPHLKSKYEGSCRVNVLTAIRATTAAPTFFRPIPWQGGLYGDGALVANNPTSIALQEAGLIYPGVPIELIVSFGTGLYSKASDDLSVDWLKIADKVIASAVSLDHIHMTVSNFFPPHQYFRFNPMLQENIPIDILNKTILADMKRIAKESFEAVENGLEGEVEMKRFETMVDLLRPKK